MRDNAAYQRERRRELVRLGLCINCKQPATRGQRCEAHALANVRNAMAHAQVRHARGKCHRCSKPTRAGKWTCQTCAENIADLDWLRRRGHRTRQS